MKSNIFTKQEIKDLFRNSWSVSWPMIIIMFIDFLIGITDVFIAGKLSKEVQATVGFVTQFYFIIIVLGNALTVGAVSTVAQFFGAGNKNGVSNTVYTVAVSSLCLGAVMGLLSIFFSAPLMSILNIPEELRKYAVPLIRIYSAGIIFHFFLITSNGLLRGSRMVKHSLLTMTIVCCINIASNFILVFHTPLGFNGIVFSTVLSYLIGSIVNFFQIQKLLMPSRVFDKIVLKKIIKIGWPNGLLQIAWQTGGTMLYLIISSLPANTVEIMAAYTNGLRIEAAIYVIAYALNSANAVIVGNLIGEGRIKEAMKNGIMTALIGVVFIAIQTVIVILNAENLSRFLSNNDMVVKESMRYLYIAMAFEPVMAWAVIISGGLNGAGDTKSVMKVVLLSQWLARLPLAYFTGVYLGLGPAAVWWSMNASIISHALFISIRFFRKKWLPSPTR